VVPLPMTLSDLGGHRYNLKPFYIHHVMKNVDWSRSDIPNES